MNPKQHDYGCVSPVGEEEIQSGLHQISGFEQMRYLSEEVEVTWQDCEKWDTTWLPLSLVEKHLAHVQIQYFKRHRKKKAQETFNKWVLKKKNELRTQRDRSKSIYPNKKMSRKQRTKKVVT